MKTVLNLTIPDSVQRTWQNTVNLMAEILNIPAGLIMRGHEKEIEVFSSSRTDGNVYKRGDVHAFQSPELYCEHVMKKQEMLLVSNALKSDVWKNSPDAEAGMIAYLGLPVNWPNGEAFGTICILDNKENGFSDTAIEFIDQMRQHIEINLKGVYDHWLLKATKEELELQNHHLNSHMTIANEYMKMVHFSEGGEIESSSDAFDTWIRHKQKSNVKAFLPIESPYTFEQIISRVDRMGIYKDEIEIETSESKSANALISIKKRNFQSEDRSYTMIFEDITNFNYYDDMTGLPNRKSLIKKIEALLGEDKAFYLVFADVDGFKNLNDLRGHSMGDVLLKHISQILRSFVTDDISVYRWGGDEFIFTFENASYTKVVDELESLSEKINEPFDVSGCFMSASMSMGIVHYPKDGRKAEELISKADVAMYMSKSVGKGEYEFFDEKLSKVYYENITISNKMQLKTFKEELAVYYQPKLCMATNSVIGVEALARWIDSEGTLVPPDKFIPIAEKNGMVGIVDKFVIAKAFDDISRINATREKGLTVAVNLSTVSLNWHTVNYIKEQLIKSEIDPEHVEIEITETAHIARIEDVKSVLDALNDLGVSVAIDDFGQAHASLHYLLKLPVSSVKIDKEFVKHIFIESYGDEIVKSIISLSKVLGKKVVAEGIETVEQLEYLKDLGCDEYQGYLASRPVGLETLKKLIGY